MRASSSSSSAALELRVCFLWRSEWSAFGPGIAWDRKRVCVLLVQGLFDVAAGVFS